MGKRKKNLMPKIYRMRIDSGQNGLCNQLCVLINAIEEAIRIMSLGVGVVYKKLVHSAFYGNLPIPVLPTGYIRIDNNLIHIDPPNAIKELRITWNSTIPHRTSIYNELEYIHCLDNIPDEVHIIVGQFFPNFDNNFSIPLDTIIDIDSMNKLMVNLNIKLLPSSYKGEAIDLRNMCHSNTPRKTTLFRNIVANLLVFNRPILENIHLNNTDKLTVIHLRNETDAIRFWSGINRVAPHIFETILMEAYKSVITEYITISSRVLVLTYRTQQNPVLEWMSKIGYNWFCIDKSPDGREISALNDMIAASYCNDVLICACNPHTTTGSTFSYFIYSKLRYKAQKIICLDMDHMCRVIEI